jgi:hypothetical protein
MWWLLFPLAGFLAALPCAYYWGGRGAIVMLVLSVVVGEGLAFAITLDPSQTDPYALSPSFRAMVGILEAVLLLLGAFPGCVIGYGFRPAPGRQKISN